MFTVFNLHIDIKSTFFTSVVLSFIFVIIIFLIFRLYKAFFDLELSDKNYNIVDSKDYFIKKIIKINKKDDFAFEFNKIFREYLDKQKIIKGSIYLSKNEIVSKLGKTKDLDIFLNSIEHREFSGNLDKTENFESLKNFLINFINSN